MLELAELEDEENLNARCIEAGMMPIEVYKMLILTRFQK